MTSLHDASIAQMLLRGASHIAEHCETVVSEEQVKNDTEQKNTNRRWPASAFNMDVDAPLYGGTAVPREEVLERKLSLLNIELDLRRDPSADGQLVAANEATNCLLRANPPSNVDCERNDTNLWTGPIYTQQMRDQCSTIVLYNRAFNKRIQVPLPPNYPPQPQGVLIFSAFTADPRIFRPNEWKPFTLGTKRLHVPMVIDIYSLGFLRMFYYLPMVNMTRNNDSLFPLGVVAMELFDTNDIDKGSSSSTPPPQQERKHADKKQIVQTFRNTTRTVKHLFQKRSAAMLRRFQGPTSSNT